MPSFEGILRCTLNDAQGKSPDSLIERLKKSKKILLKNYAICEIYDIIVSGILFL